MIQDIFPHHFDNHYIPHQTISDNDYILHFKDNKLMIKVSGEKAELPRKRELPEIYRKVDATFLFTIDNTSCFIVWDNITDHAGTFTYREMQFFRTVPQPEMAWISLVGFHLHHWYLEHAYCGKCGTKTAHKEDERAMYCPNCHALFFPKISPAIIVAITSGDKILLANNANFKFGWFSLIAGYVDVGETLEETVRREVKEEVGIDIRNIRYYTSQPWPLSGSLMVGFTAEADESQPIEIDHKEIVEAHWFKRGNLPEHPTNTSIAGEMIDKFERGAL